VESHEAEYRCAGSRRDTSAGVPRPGVLVGKQQRASIRAQEFRGKQEHVVIPVREVVARRSVSVAACIIRRPEG
jgi:hypothetical protein